MKRRSGTSRDGQNDDQRQAPQDGVGIGHGIGFL